MESENSVIRIYTTVDPDLRLHGYVAAANEFDFSVTIKGVDYDEALRRFVGQVLPAIAQYDAWLSEMYDGNIDAEEPKIALGLIQEFKRWAELHDLQQHGDFMDVFGD